MHGHSSAERGGLNAPLQLPVTTRVCSRHVLHLAHMHTPGLGPFPKKTELLACERYILLLKVSSRIEG